MAQHVVLTMVAAPLIALGAPVSTTLAMLAPSRRRLLARLVQSRAARLVDSAPVAWLLYIGAVWLVHFTSFFDRAVTDEGLHACEHVLFLAVGVLFWRHAVGRDPLVRLPPVRRIAYLMTAMPAMDVVGVWLMSSRGVEYPAYGTGPAALEAQHTAGMVMLAGSYALALAALAAAWELVRNEQHRADLAERRA